MMHLHKALTKEGPNVCSLFFCSRGLIEFPLNIKDLPVHMEQTHCHCQAPHLRRQTLHLHRHRDQNTNGPPPEIDKSRKWPYHRHCFSIQPKSSPTSSKSIAISSKSTSSTPSFEVVTWHRRPRSGDPYHCNLHRNLYTLLRRRFRRWKWRT